MRLSVTLRIALLSIALAFVSNLVLIGFVWKQTHDAAIDAVRRDTVEQSDSLIAAYRSGGLTALRGAVADADSASDPSLMVALLDDTGRRVTGAGPRVFVQPLAAGGFRIARVGTEAPWSRRDTGYVLRRADRYWLINGRLLDLVEQEQRAIERALALSMLLSLALGIAGGVVVSRYVAGRLNAIAKVVQGVADGDLQRRVTLVAGTGPEGGDAFDRLAARLNTMLDRLGALMAELRVVTDSLAHDLRSPLTRLRTKTENALLQPDPQTREAALAGLLVETDLVMRMLTMVIEISRSESATRDRFVAIDPASLVEEIAELYAPVLEDAGLRFQVAIDTRPPPIPIHRELLSQAITNLLDNAIRHGGAGGEVTLRLADGDAVRIQVEDRGAGIAAADRGQALKRFGRLDTARSIPGAGLGLTLIEAVARLHGGRFELDDNAPGLIGRIVLPVI